MLLIGFRGACLGEQLIQRGANPRVDRAEHLPKPGGGGLDLPGDERPVEEHERKTSRLSGNAARPDAVVERDGAFQRGRDPVYGAAAHATRRREDRWIALATLQGEHEKQAEEFGTRLEHARQVVQGSRKIRSRCDRNRLEEAISRLLHNSSKKPLLASEGPIDRGRADVCHAADLRDRRGRIPLLGEQSSRHAQHLLSRVRPFEMTPRLGHGRILNDRYSLVKGQVSRPPRSMVPCAVSLVRRRGLHFGLWSRGGRIENPRERLVHMPIAWHDRPPEEAMKCIAVPSRRRYENKERDPSSRLSIPAQRASRPFRTAPCSTASGTLMLHAPEAEHESP